MKGLWDAHLDLPLPKSSSSSLELIMVKSDMFFAHYGHGGVDDRGYGCGYRSLQTLAAWIARQKGLDLSKVVPSLSLIQRQLVALGDKPQSFVDSREWIGCIETSLVLDTLLDTPCKLVHVPQKQLRSVGVPALKKHFEQFGAPVQMGGDTDAMSKAICGMAINQNNNEVHLLVMDPHYYRGIFDEDDNEKRNEILQKWIRWSNIDSGHDFRANSFYNICMPQLRAVFR